MIPQGSVASRDDDVRFLAGDFLTPSSGPQGATPLAYLAFLAPASTGAYLVALSAARCRRAWQRYLVVPVLLPALPMREIRSAA